MSRAIRGICNFLQLVMVKYWSTLSYFVSEACLTSFCFAINFCYYIKYIVYQSFIFGLLFLYFFFDCSCINNRFFYFFSLLNKGFGLRLLFHFSWHNLGFFNAFWSTDTNRLEHAWITLWNKWTLSLSFSLTALFLLSFLIGNFDEKSFWEMIFLIFRPKLFEVFLVQGIRTL